MQQRLVALLADGRTHSGAALARALGIGRGPARRLLLSLDEMGLRVRAVRGRGYRLAEALELLAPARVLAELDETSYRLLGGLEVLGSVDSTNRHLLDRADAGMSPGSVCLAEHQSAGRGRRGRTWLSPFGASIPLSVYWRFEGARALQGLSLAVGVAAAEAVEGLGIGEVALKWPNDLLWRGRKLGGVLVEAVGKPTGVRHVVVGVGLNARLSPRAAAVIDQPWTDLATAAGRDPGRNRAAGLLMHHLLRTLDRFAREGFAPFREAWVRRDAVRGRVVELRAPDRVLHGEARGIDADGALLLAVGGVVRPVSSGEISLRLVS